jgi:hypothetical protein
VFSARFHNAALAFAGALVVATTLMTTAASASSESSPPVEADVVTIPLANTSTESVSGLPILDLPRTDVRVEGLWAQTNPQNGHVTYLFRVKNEGPDGIKFNVKTRSYYHYVGDSKMYDIEKNQEMTLFNGQHEDVSVICNNGHVCHSAHLWVDRLIGFDTDTSNNLAVEHAH